jgi:hypothetical protein
MAAGLSRSLGLGLVDRRLIASIALSARAQNGNDGYASLSVLEGHYYLRIAVAPAGAPPSLAAEKQLATAILPKL